jgi:para-aminobenzoate synthetase component 1
MIIPAPVMEPGEALLRLSRGERPFLLEGGVDADGLGRYSLCGCDPTDGLVWRRGDAGDPLALLEAAQRRWSAGPVDDGPWPLSVGYLSYDLAREVLARAPLTAVDDLGLPEVDFARYPAVWRLDRATGKAAVLSHDGAAAERLLQRLYRAAPPLPPLRLGAPRWVISDEEYRRRVERVLEYLRAGDCYQVNLSHRLAAECDGALALYLRLARAPLGAYLRTEACELLSNTPELFLRQRGAQVQTRPIKGTRRRADGEDDARLAAELDQSAKDAAEHLMIVDLERNDLGRVAEIGSVRVEGFKRRLELPTVHHLVSTVAARLRPGVGLAELLSALLPGGSVTGAPKLRAVEIIDELEGVVRGPYCGAIGWLGPPGRLDLALAIRTAVVRAGELILSVGGGIVADSNPAEELEETRVKAEAFLRAMRG